MKSVNLSQHNIWVMGTWPASLKPKIVLCRWKYLQIYHNGLICIFFRWRMMIAEDAYASSASSYNLHMLLAYCLEMKFGYRVTTLNVWNRVGYTIYHQPTTMNIGLVTVGHVTISRNIFTSCMMYHDHRLTLVRKIMTTQQGK